MVMGETLYMRVDEGNRGRFVDAGSEPFSCSTRKGRVFVRTYFALPDELLDDPDGLLDWARGSIAAAQRAEAAKKPRKAACKPRSR